MTDRISERRRPQAPWTARLANRVSILGRLLESRLSSIDTKVLTVIVGFSTLVTALNIGGPFILHFIDILWPLNPAGFLTNLQYAWNSVNQGTVTSVNAFNLPTAAWLYLLSAVGMPIPIQELLTLTVLQVIGGYAFYALVRRFILVEASQYHRVVAAASAICYTVNYYALVVGWWDNIPGFFLLLAFTPLLLYFALAIQTDLLHHGRPRASDVSGLAIASFLGFSTNVPFNLSLLSLALLVPPLALFTGPTTRGHVARALVAEYFLLAAVIAGTSLWWIIPDYLQSIYLPNYVGGGYSTAYNLTLFTSSSASLTVLTVLTGLFGVEYPAYAHNALSNVLYLDLGGALAAVIFAVILAGVLVAPKGLVRGRQAYLLGAVLLLGLFFLGTNSPINWILASLLESSSIALQSLRNPFLTFGFAMCVLVLLTFVHGLHSIYVRSREIKRREIAPQLGNRSRERDFFGRRASRGALNIRREVVIVAAVTLVFLPMLAADSPIIIGNAVPSSPYEARMTIPTYEYEVANFLKDRLNDTYALLYPGGFLEQNWTNGYDGYDILPSLLPNSFLIYDAQNGFVASPNPILSYAYSAIQTGTTHLLNFSALLNRLGVSVIVIEGEIGGSYPFAFNTPPEYPLILGSLNATSGLQPPIRIGPDYIYLANESTPIVTAANSAVDNSTLVSGAMVPEVNLTSLYANATSLSTPLAPSPLFSLTPSSTGETVTINASAKQSLADHPFPSPLGQFGQPIIFNGAPISVPIAEYGSLSITFSTNAFTALTISVVDAENFSDLNSSSLGSHMFVLGGPSSTLGYGTASLFPAYGADHYWTNGATVTLTDDISENAFPSNASIVYYLLFSVFPVLNGLGTAGIPVSNWSGTQSFTISSILLGNQFYASPTQASGPVSITLSSELSVDNLTRSYLAAVTQQNSSLAPPPDFVPATENGYLNATLNQSLKAHIAADPLGAPFGQGYPPSVYNGVPIRIPLGSYAYLGLSFLTNSSTAVTFSLIDESNLTDLNQSTLSDATLTLGGLGNSLGLGDPLLFPAFGADHFVSVNRSTAMTQQISDLSAHPISPDAFYLVVSFFPVAPNGTGIRFVPVQNWTGIQHFTLSSLDVSTYLVDGNIRSEPPSFFGPAPRVNLMGSNPFSGATAILSQRVPNLEPVRTVSIHSLSPSEIQFTLSSSASEVGPFLVILHQNFAPGWFLEGNGLASSTHLVVDTDYNGFLLYLDRNTSTVTLTAVFSGQSPYDSALEVGLSIAGISIVSPPLIAMVLRRSKSRRSGN